VQLQNNSALGVNLRNDELASTLITTVEPNLRTTKLKQYMHDGLGVCQTKRWEKTTFLAYTTHNPHNIQTPSRGQNNIISAEVATNPLFLKLHLNLQKHSDSYFCSFKKISMRRKKTVLQDKFDLKINFVFFLT